MNDEIVHITCLFGSVEVQVREVHSVDRISMQHRRIDRDGDGNVTLTSPWEESLVLHLDPPPSRPWWRGFWR